MPFRHDFLRLLMRVIFMPCHASADADFRFFAALFSDYIHWPPCRFLIVAATLRRQLSPALIDAAFDAFCRFSRMRTYAF